MCSRKTWNLIRKLGNDRTANNQQPNITTNQLKIAKIGAGLELATLTPE